jgi:hypothetical protein
MAVIIVRRIIGELGPTFLKRVRWEFSLTMALVALVFSFGVRKLLHTRPGETVPLRVAAIQPNVPQIEKFNPRWRTDLCPAGAADEPRRRFGTAAAACALARQPPPRAACMRTKEITAS